MDTKKPAHVYISGPMTGLPELNMPAFFAAQAALEGQGYKVCNPVTVGKEAFGDVRPETPEEQLPFLKADIAAILKCDGMALLSGWERSKGARVEAALAITLGFLFVQWETGRVVPRPRQVTVTCGYFEKENEGPGSHGDERKALLQLVSYGFKLAPQATGLSHAMGFVLQAADREQRYKPLIEKYAKRYIEMYGISTTALHTPEECDMVARIVEGLRT